MGQSPKVYMYTASVKLTFIVNHGDSLKDKRRICRGVIARVRQKFNVSVAEVCAQDKLRRLVLGVAVVSGDADHARQCLEEVIRFMESQVDGDLVEIME